MDRTLTPSITYPPAVLAILPGEALPSLDAGRPREAMRERFAGLSTEDLFAGQIVRDEAMARCCLAGLWLAHDFLDESHRISQDLPSTSGSFWHAIMHRREGDFGNAKYWFQRVGPHAIFPDLCRAARDLASREPAAEARFLVAQSEWDADRFVDLVEASVRGRSSCGTLCQQIAQAEWRLLFEHCYRQACSPGIPSV